MPNLEEMPEGAASAAMAAFHLVQGLIEFLVRSQIMNKETALFMLRNAARSQSAVMDEVWAPENEGAVHLLEAFAKSLEQAEWFKNLP